MAVPCLEGSGKKPPKLERGLKKAENESFSAFSVSLSLVVLR